MQARLRRPGGPARTTRWPGRIPRGRARGQRRPGPAPRRPGQHPRRPRPPRPGSGPGCAGPGLVGPGLAGPGAGIGRRYGTGGPWPVRIGWYRGHDLGTLPERDIREIGGGLRHQSRPGFEPAGPAQRGGELRAGAVPLRRDLGQRLRHHLVHGRGQIGAAAGQRGRRGGDLGPHDRDRLVPDERRVGGEHGERGAGQRVLVRAPGHRPGLDLLRRDIVQRAEELAGGSQRADRQGPLAQAEVGKVRVAGIVPPARHIEQHVARLDVPVHQPVRMSRLQAGRDLGDDVAGAGGRLRPLGVHELLHVRPVHEAHRDEQHPVGLARLEDRDDVGVVHGGRGARFADEPLPERLVPGQLGRQHLDRDRALEPDVVGAVDHGHAAPADLLVEPVPGQAGPDAEAPKIRGLVRHRGPPAHVRVSQYSEISLDPLVTWGTLLSLDP